MAFGIAARRRKPRHCIHCSNSIVFLIIIPNALCWLATTNLVPGNGRITLLGSQRRLRACAKADSSGTASANSDLMLLRKRELIELLRRYGEDSSGMGKMDIVARLTSLRKDRPDVESQEAGAAAPKVSPRAEAEPVTSVLQQETSIDAKPQFDPPQGTAVPKVSQREVAETAMDDWQNSTTFGFDCKRGHLVDDGVIFDVVGSSGNVLHKVYFSEKWPPTCTCDDAQQWGSQQRCKHVCMILVKCGVPYAAVSDSGYNPDEMEVRSIVQHMRGRWSPIPLTDDR